MTPLINIDELKLIRDIGNKPDVNKINPIILQAQDVDLRDYLGMKFYFDVLANAEQPSYQHLLSGSTFQYDGISFYHEGLRSMLADLIMARYTNEINVNITPFGAVVKTSDQSVPVDRNSLRDKAQIERTAAASKWEIIKLYLKSNRVLFPIYNNSPDSSISGEKKLRIRKL